MPPSQRHAMVRPIHHLKRAVAAHAAIGIQIARHAQAEHEAREAAMAKKQRDDKLTPPVNPSGA